VAKTARLFKKGESQAVLLPEEIRFPGKEVYIEERRGVVILRAKKAVHWTMYFSRPSPFPPDFLAYRKDLKLQNRKCIHLDAEQAPAQPHTARALWRRHPTGLAGAQKRRRSEIRRRKAAASRRTPNQQMPTPQGGAGATGGRVRGGGRRGRRP
jgi:antitoxin VapB